MKDWANFLRWIARWGPWVYAFLAVAMVFGAYFTVRNGNSRLVGPFVLPFMVGVFGCMTMVKLRPFWLRRADQLEAMEDPFQDPEQ